MANNNAITFFIIKRIISDCKVGQKDDMVMENSFTFGKYNFLILNLLQTN